MRMLVLGAGAVGGYYGGRLLESGQDVTFLVRPRRAAQLADRGLSIHSPHGDFHRAEPPTVLADCVRGPFDVVFIGCKAYDLPGAIEAIAPAVGDHTAVVPMLNGWKHLQILDDRFGPAKILGGRCFISSRLAEDGSIDHLSDPHELSFGARSVDQSDVAERILDATSSAKFLARKSDQILLDMWEKWVFLATLAGMTCLNRASIGDIASAGGSDLVKRLFEECCSIARDSGWEIRPGWIERSLSILTDPHSTMTASMLSDLEKGFQTEADHVLGDLLHRCDPARPASLLRIAHIALKAQEARQLRQAPPQDR